MAGAKLLQFALSFSAEATELTISRLQRIQTASIQIDQPRRSIDGQFAALHLSTPMAQKGAIDAVGITAAGLEQPGATSN